MRNSQEIVNAYINLFNARREVDGESQIPIEDIPLYEKALSIAPISVLDSSGMKAEEYVEGAVKMWKQNK
jgi:hypothetical protein